MIKLLEFFGLPINASEHGARIDLTMGYVHILMLVLFVGWGAFFVYTLFRFRRSRSPKADYHGVKSHASSYLELTVAVIEGALLVLLSIPLWAERVADFPDEADSTVVRVVAQQFAWNVHYPGPDGQFGRSDTALVSESNVIGLDWEDPAAADDVMAINQLHLPVNKPAIIQLSSMDVIHSFSLPEMRVKQDAIPGMRIPLWFIPTMTTEEMREAKVKQGVLKEEDKAMHNYTIACAQLCGLGHYRMRGMMTIHPSQEAFDQWRQAEFEASREEEEEEYEEEGEGEAGEEGEELEEEAAEEGEEVESEGEMEETTEEAVEETPEEAGP